MVLVCAAHGGWQGYGFLKLDYWCHGSVRSQEVAITQCNSSRAVHLEAVLVVARGFHYHFRSVPLGWVRTLLILEENSLTEGEGAQRACMRCQRLLSRKYVCEALPFWLPMLDARRVEREGFNISQGG